MHHTTLNERVIVVVDHFSLTSQWHIALKEALNAKVVVIDGLADRTLKCDVLIDPNLVLDAKKKWDGKIQNNTKLMIGPQYFPLREEFAFPPPTLPQALKRIFVCFGGMDKDNALRLKPISQLEKELETNVGLKVNFDTGDNYEVAGRGELHLSVLIETMRREGYELQIGQPQVLFKEIDGRKNEPVE